MRFVTSYMTVPCVIIIGGARLSAPVSASFGVMLHVGPGAGLRTLYRQLLAK